MNIHTVLDLIHRHAEDGRVTFLAGAGISFPPPSSLPTVPRILDREFDRLTKELPHFQEALARCASYYQTAPFEEFMSVVRAGLLFRYDELLDDVKGGQPNSYHAFLAATLVSGTQTSVLTTNFDNLIEKCLGSYLDRILITFDINPPTSTGPVLAKLHGSFWDTHGNDIRKTIAATIESITRGMSPNVVERWARYLDQRLIIVMGYSGRDRHDILPILWRSTGPFIWISHRDGSPLKINEKSGHSSELTPEVAELLFARNSSVFVEGETREFLRHAGRVFGVNFDSITPGKVPDVINFDGKERDVRHRVFMAPLYGKYAPLAAGFLFLHHSWPNEAMKAFHEFMQNCSEDDFRLFAIASNGIGQAFENVRAFEAAEDMYRLALRGWNMVGDASLIAQTENHIAIAARKLGDFDTALKYLESARNRASAIDDPYVLGMTFHNLGVLYEKRRQHHLSINQFRLALEAKERAGDYLNRVESLKGVIYNTHILDGYTEECVDWCIERLRLFWAFGWNVVSALGINVAYESAMTELLYALAMVYPDGGAARCQNDHFLVNSGMLYQLNARGVPRA